MGDKFRPFLLIAIFSFVSFSCRKEALKETDLPAENAAGKISESLDGEVPDPQIPETFQEAMVLSKNTPLNLLGRDGKMHAIRSLLAGAKVEAVFMDGIADTKTVGENNYTKVVYDSVDYWINGANIALNVIEAVVTEASTLFSDSELTQPIYGVPRLRFGTLVACQPSLPGDDAESTEGLEKTRGTKIFYFDKNLSQVKEAYVLEENISARRDDIAVASVVEALKTTKRESIRTKLWDEAGRYNPCKKVLAALEEQKIERQSYNYEEVVKSLRKVGMGVNVEELMTVDQSKDPFK